MSSDVWNSQGIAVHHIKTMVRPRADSARSGAFEFKTFSKLGGNDDRLLVASPEHIEPVLRFRCTNLGCGYECNLVDEERTG